MKSARKTSEIASGLGIYRSKRREIGCTPNAMKAAITKIAIVLGMCRDDQNGDDQEHDSAGDPRDATPDVCCLEWFA